MASGCIKGNLDKSWMMFSVARYREDLRGSGEGGTDKLKH